MTFIPHPTSPIAVGDTVELLDKCSNFSGTFTEGHKFKVDSINEHKGMVVFNLIDVDNRRLNDVKRKYLKTYE